MLHLALIWMWLHTFPLFCHYKGGAKSKRFVLPPFFTTGEASHGCARGTALWDRRISLLTWSQSKHAGNFKVLKLIQWNMPYWGDVSELGAFSVNCNRNQCFNEVWNCDYIWREDICSTSVSLSWRRGVLLTIDMWRFLLAELSLEFDICDDGGGVEGQHFLCRLIWVGIWNATGHTLRIVCETVATADLNVISYCPASFGGRLYQTNEFKWDCLGPL